MKKKSLSIILILILSFGTVFAIPQKQVEAVAFGAAIPAGITIGAGGYALGALGLAGLVGAVGYAEHEEAINAHAKGVWEGGTQTAMDSLNASIELAKNAGNGIVNLQSDFINFAEGKLQGIASNNYELSTGSIDEGVKISGNIMGSYATKTIRTTNTSNTDPTVHFYFNGKAATEINLAISGGSAGIGYIRTDVFYLDGTRDVVTNEVTSAFAFSINSGFYGLTTLQELKYYASTYFGASVLIGNDAVPVDMEIYNQGLSKVTEAWRDMRDAGMVLPVDSAIPLSSIDGSPLTYNPDADAYTGIDGGTYTGTPDWAFPQPTIRVANPDIPTSVPTTGVYVDTPVLTGNPTWDKVITGDPAIPNTTTNIQTGVTVGNPDMAITEPVPDGGGTPEDGDSCAKLKFPIFSPLKEQFSTSFPFSIPWDIGRAINAAFAEIGNDKPEFELDLAFMGEQKTIKITMPKMFDDWKPFSDSLLLFIFDVMIMFGIYRFVKGAGS